jgi:membrane-associated phospholipid phosphatase
MIAITKLGDSGVLLPVAFLLLLSLCALRARRTAMWWASAVALCAVVTVTAKIGLQSCLFGWSVGALRSPSGHTSLSTTVYGSCALVLAADASRWRRLVAIGAGALIIGAIAASRVYLHAHTGPEVIVGLVIGLLCVAWFGYGAARSGEGEVPWQAVVALAVLAVAVTYGAHIDLEDIIRAIAHQLGLGSGACAAT